MCVCVQWFGYYKPGQTSDMYTMQESSLYTEVSADLMLGLLAVSYNKYFIYVMCHRYSVTY